jgi:hypothetical protein
VDRVRGSGRDGLADQAETFQGGAVEGWVYCTVTLEDAAAGRFIAFDPDVNYEKSPGGVGFFDVTPPPRLRPRAESPQRFPPGLFDSGTSVTVLLR